MRDHNDHIVLETLVERIKNRDQSALSDLYDHMGRIVYSLAYAIVRSHEDAEEVTQEVFVRVWDKAMLFDTSLGSVPAWLSTITRRLAIDRTRSKSYRARGREAALEAVSGTAQSADAASVDDVVQAGQVLDALQTLGEGYQDVVRLSYFEGMSHSQIAEKLDIPLGTVKSRLREGVVRLRQQLGIK